MRILFIILIVALILTIFTLANYYIFRRLLSVVPESSTIRTPVVLLFWFIAFSFLIGRLLEKVSVTFVSDLLIWIGSFWFAVMLYAVLSLLIIDIFRLINHFLPFYPDFITRDILNTKRVLAFCITGFIAIMVLSGFINSRTIASKEISINIDKYAGNLKKLKVVMFSDLHLGSIIGKKFAKKVVDRVNDLNPDIILIPGDLIDEDIAPVMKDGICDELRRFTSKYGTYAVTGNHEYIGDVQTAVEYLEQNGIKMLRDTSLFIDSSFYVIGREDISSTRYEYNRKSISELLNGVDKIYPIIMLDHQPFKLDEVAQSGIDLQLSGHTHNGQLWPLNFITDLIYELSWGYKQKDHSHFYISCGVGGWGPPARIGSRPEIVALKLVFK